MAVGIRDIGLEGLRFQRFRVCLLLALGNLVAGSF